MHALEDWAILAQKAIDHINLILVERVFKALLLQNALVAIQSFPLVVEVQSQVGTASDS